MEYACTCAVFVLLHRQSFELLTTNALRWHHNERGGVSNHRRFDCSLNRLFSRRSKKTSLKAPRHWPLWGEFTCDQWIPLTKGPKRGKCFYLMTSSWHPLQVWVLSLTLVQSMQVKYAWRILVKLTPTIAKQSTSMRHMMMSSNGNFSRVTGPLWGESTGNRRTTLTKASDAEFDVFFDLRLNKRLIK